MLLLLLVVPLVLLDAYSVLLRDPVPHPAIKGTSCHKRKSSPKYFFSAGTTQQALHSRHYTAGTTQQALHSEHYTEARHSRHYTEARQGYKNRVQEQEQKTTTAVRE
jgi:hypothetical protein